jgi:hypothetical protein
MVTELGLVWLDGSVGDARCGKDRSVRFEIINVSNGVGNWQALRCSRLSSRGVRWQGFSQDGRLLPAVGCGREGLPCGWGTSGESISMRAVMRTFGQGEKGLG